MIVKNYLQQYSFNKYVFIQIFYSILNNNKPVYNTLQMLNLQSYTQMGYTQAQVRKAFEYSQRNRIDIFDALQQIQNSQNAEYERKMQTGIPAFSYLSHMRKFNLHEYEVIFSRSGVKESNFAKDELREENIPVGLFNVANCCYLNSLLQCYFLMGAFTREILEAEEMPELPQSLVQSKQKIIKNQYLLLGALKEIFAKMRLSSRRYLDPTPVLKNLINSVGQKISYGDQKDLNEINMEIVDRLSQCLMHTRKYYGSISKVEKRENIKNLFYGEKVQYIQGLEGESVVDFMGIFLNPKHQNFMSALDSQFNYEVEIDGKILKKHTLIRTLPTYLFFSINLTDYEKKEDRMRKNSNKLAFDFQIYLDQYLEQNKEQTKLKNPKIKELQWRKNQIRNKLYHLDLMAQKLEQCRAHAQYLTGWVEKLPRREDIQAQKFRYKKLMEQIEKQLSTIQSRKQKYMLMYLFVHRGDAISGHYWGYGRNGDRWYKFDVNCIPTNQGDMLLDMEKSNGTPYALVYAKAGHIQSFQYPYYLTDETDALLLDITEVKTDYSDFISARLKNIVIKENIAMHAYIEKQKNKKFVENVLKEYRGKYNIVKAEAQRYIVSHKNTKIPLYSNFACFLESSGQSELMKYNLFELALLSKGQMTYSQLKKNQPLLKIIQNAFRKKIKGRMSLITFDIENNPIESAKYKQFADSYVVGKKCLEFLKIISQNIKDWPKISNLSNYLQDISEVLSSNVNIAYLKNVTRELVAIMLIDLAKKQAPISTKWAVACGQQNPLIKQQLKSLNCRQIASQYKQKGNRTSISQIALQNSWNLTSLKKGFQNNILEGIKDILEVLHEGLTIYKVNTKQNKVVREAEVKNDPYYQSLI